MKPILDFGFIQLPTFYLLLSLGLTVSLFFLSHRLDQDKTYDRKTAFDLALTIMISGFIGGRLMHVLYEAPEYYLRYPSLIFKFWNGGFVYFGGMFSALLASIAFLKIKKESFIRWADFSAPVLSLSYALGRIGCFFEGCCYGSYCTFPWAVSNRHPTQIYMSLAEFILLLFILKLKKMPLGYLFFIWLFGHSLSRFVIEFFREDDRGFVIANILSISQVISLFIMFFSLCSLKKIQSKPI